MTEAEAAELVETLVIACPNQSTTVAVLASLRRTWLYKRDQVFARMVEEVLHTYRTTHGIPLSAVPWS